MNKLKYIFYILQIILYINQLCKAQVQTEFRFYAPNELAHNGTTCTSLRPTQTLKCGTFGILTLESDVNEVNNPIFMSQQEIEDRCAALGFSICTEGHLFPDGECRKCEDPYIVAGDGTGDLWCQKNDDENDIITFNNPFNCLNTAAAEIPRTIQNSYRPCLYKPGLDQVDIEHYYARDDLEGQKTMSECWIQIVKNSANPGLYNLTDTDADTDEDIDFPKVMHEYPDLIYGFNLCPIASSEYSFTTGWWIALYVFYAFGFLVVFSHLFFRKYKDNEFESRKLVDLNKKDREGTVVNTLEIDIANSHHVDQYGLKSTYFSNISWLLYWLMTWGLMLFNLMLILDIYGLFKNWLCKSHVNERCKDDPLSFREGYACTSGCLFSHRSSTGTDIYWPWHNNPFSIDQMFGIYLTVFYISLIWWTITITFYANIKNSFYIKCDFYEATSAVCYKDREQDIRLEEDKNDRIIKIVSYFENLVHKYIKKPRHAEICKIYKDNTGMKYLYFQCIKYLYDKNEDKFLVKTPIIGKTKNELYALGSSGLSSNDAFKLLQVAGENKIKYDIPGWALSFWEEYFNLYSYLQILFILLWYFNYYWIVGITATVVVTTSATIRMLVRRSSRKNMKSISENYTMVDVKRDSKWVTISSHQLVPGDIIKIKPGDDIAADCILVSGRAVMNESSLTGEPSPVPKLSLPNLNEYYGISVEDLKYTLLSGTKVESVSPGPDGTACGLVFTTGINTKKGQLLWAMLFPPQIRFKFDDHLVAVYVVLFIVAIPTFIIIGWLMYWTPHAMLQNTSMLTNLINPMMPVMFAGGQAKGSIDLKKDCNVFTLELHRIFLAGKLKIFCFDKTGTLTKQGMDFNGYSILNDKNNKLEFSNTITNDTETIRNFMGCCQELEFLTHENSRMPYVGNEVDTAMFEESSYSFVRNTEQTTLLLDKKTNKHWTILKRFEFSRENMMMSSIIRDENTKELFVLSKGSYERVLGNCKSITNKNELDQFVTHYSTMGHYILGIAKKKLPNDREIHSYERTDLEKDLNFFGLIHFKNDLKRDTKDVLEHVYRGSVRCLMITGDNVYTACSIAKESGLSYSKKIFIGDVEDSSPSEVVWTDFSTLQRVSLLENLDEIKKGDIDLAVTYKSFNLLKNLPVTNLIKNYDPNDVYHQNLVHYLIKHIKIYARMKPDHKVEAVRINMKFGVTGMCGDGANDAAALRMAHCGIAISSGSGHATIVAPFNSSRESLAVVTDVIRHGRGSLATAFAGFKRLISFTIVMLSMRFYSYHSYIQLSWFCWMYFDMFLNIGLTVGMIWSKPSKKLTPYRPTCSLFGKEIVGCLLTHGVVSVVGFYMAFYILFQQEFFSCKMFDPSLVVLAFWWTMGDNYESTMLGIMICSLALNHAFVFNFGYDFRKKWFYNYVLLFFWGLYFIILAVVILTDATSLGCLFRWNCGDHYLLEKWNQLGLITYSGTIESRGGQIPLGCPCDQQVRETELCDQPYINCNTPNQFNSEYHHTIMPMDFRWKIWGYTMGLFVINMIIEFVIFYGPVRKSLRQKRRQKIYSGNNFY